MPMNETLVNQTMAQGFNILSVQGIIIAIVGLALVIVAGYIVYKVLKNLVANAIIGGVGLIALHFLAPMVGLEIPFSLTNIIISLVAGLPGLVIVILFSVLHL